MKNIRSPFLRTVPRKASAGRKHSPQKRLFLVLFLAALIGAPVFIIVTRILPEQGVGQVFYWMHDHIYLPVKGFTYTLFYPFSLGWWGPIATILAVWLMSYLMRVSLTKDLHAQVLRKIVRRKSKHRLLLSTTRWLRKWKFEALLFQEIAGQERQKALHRLAAVPMKQIDEPASDELYHLTILHIKLLTMGSAGELEYLNAASIWQQTYMQLKNRLERNRQNEQLKELTANLAAMIDAMLLPLLDYHDEVQLKEVKEIPGGFDTATVCLDLFYLGSLYNEPLAAHLYGDPENPDKTADLYSRALIIAKRLAETTASRRGLIDQTRITAEKLRKRELNSTLFLENEDNKAQHPLLLDDNEELPIICRIIMSICLDLAGLMEEPAIGLAFIEAVEALEFELNSLDPQLWEEGLQRPLEFLPAPIDYRWCAELAEEQLTAYEKAWTQTPSGEEPLITPGDFQLARTRIRALYHAAGPSFDASGDHHAARGPS
jgi:hypothetical protein